MTKSKQVRLAITNGKNLKVSQYFTTERVEYHIKGKNLTKTIFKAKNSNLVPRHVSYVLYHESKDVFAGGYLRARCSKRRQLLSTGANKGKHANCGAALYIPKDDYSSFQFNKDIKHSCEQIKVDQYLDQINELEMDNISAEQRIQRRMDQRQLSEESKKRKMPSEQLNLYDQASSSLLKNSKYHKLKLYQHIEHNPLETSSVDNHLMYQMKQWQQQQFIHQSSDILSQPITTRGPHQSLNFMAHPFEVASQITHFDLIKSNIQPHSFPPGEISPFRLNYSASTIMENLGNAINILNSGQNFDQKSQVIGLLEESKLYLLQLFNQSHANETPLQQLPLPQSDLTQIPNQAFSSHQSSPFTSVATSGIKEMHQLNQTSMKASPAEVNQIKPSSTVQLNAKTPNETSTMNKNKHKDPKLQEKLANGINLFLSRESKLPSYIESSEKTKDQAQLLKSGDEINQLTQMQLQSDKKTTLIIPTANVSAALQSEKPKLPFEQIKMQLCHFMGDLHFEDLQKLVQNAYPASSKVLCDPLAPFVDQFFLQFMPGLSYQHLTDRQKTLLYKRFAKAVIENSLAALKKAGINFVRTNSYLKEACERLFGDGPCEDYTQFMFEHSFFKEVVNALNKKQGNLDLNTENNQTIKQNLISTPPSKKAQATNEAAPRDRRSSAMQMQTRSSGKK